MKKVPFWCKYICAIYTVFKWAGYHQKTSWGVISPRHYFQVKLTGHGQEGWDGEEGVLIGIALWALWLFWYSHTFTWRRTFTDNTDVQNTKLIWGLSKMNLFTHVNPKELSCTLTVIWGDDRSVNLSIAVFLRKTTKNKNIVMVGRKIMIQLYSGYAKVKFLCFERCTLKYEWIAAVASLRILNREPKTLVLHLRWGNWRI